MAALKLNITRRTSPVVDNVLHRFWRLATRMTFTVYQFSYEFHGKAYALYAESETSMQNNATGRLFNFIICFALSYFHLFAFHYLDF